MSQNSVNRVGDGALGAGLAVVLFGSQLILLLLPRPVVPRDMPPVRWERSAEARQIRTDRERARETPTDPASLELDRLYEELGRAESGLPEPLDVAAHRRAAIRQAVSRIEQSQGEPGLEAMRSRWVVAFDALDASGSTPQNTDKRRAILGSFPRLSERFGLTSSGRRIAPPFVLRTAYKARVNVALGRDPDAGFTEVERDAYHGWIAIRMAALPIDQRLASASKLGPSYAAALAEIRAKLFFDAAEYGKARELYGALHAQTGAARYRNFALAAEALAQD